VYHEFCLLSQSMRLDIIVINKIKFKCSSTLMLLDLSNLLNIRALVATVFQIQAFCDILCICTRSVQ